MTTQRRSALAAAGCLLALVASAARAACVGDCDGENGVAIHEIVRAVNVLLGRLELTMCPNADRDGNGEVTVDEVMAAVNSFLFGPASCPLVSEVTATPAITETATAPPTATWTPTATVTTTPTPLGSCGNGFLDGGETCELCAADCVVQPCTAATPVRVFTVSWAPPAGQDASTITVVVGYRSDRVSLPGSGSAAGSRVKNRPASSIVGVNDLDYALRVVVTRSGQIPPGRLFTVDFDGCQGAAAAVAADFGCIVVDCATSFGPVDGCTCSVAGP